MSQAFLLREKLMSIGGDLTIDDSAGNRAFLVDGKAFALRRTLILMDLAGQPLYQINASLMHVRPTFEIKQGDAIVATIQKALFTLFRDRFDVKLADEAQLTVQGDIWDHEFHVARGGVDVIEASRRWFSMRDAYGVQVAADFDVPLGLAIAIALEQMELEERGRSHTPGEF